VARVKQHDAVGARVTIFPHRPRENGGHQENSGGICDVGLIFGVTQDKFARGAGANQFKRMLIGLIVVDAGRKTFDLQRDQVRLDGMARSSRWAGGERQHSIHGRFQVSHHAKGVMKELRDRVEGDRPAREFTMSFAAEQCPEEFAFR